MIETEKAGVEVEAPATGTVVEIPGAVKRGGRVGEVIAVVDTPAA